MYLDYGKIANLMTKDLSKSHENYNRVFRYYTKEMIQKFLENPAFYEQKIRELMRFLYDKSLHYKRLIRYFAGMLTFDYIIKPYDIDVDNIDVARFKSAFIRSANFVDKMNIKHEMIKLLTIALKEDVVYGYEFEGKNSYYIHVLDPNYCEIVAIEDGIYQFAFNFRYFDTREDELEDYPKEFKKKYKKYKDNGKKDPWIVIDGEKSICLKINEDVPYPCPPFVGIIEYLFDIDEYRRLQKSKEQLEIYKLIIQKIPMREDSDINNDFLLDYDFFNHFHNNAASVVPEQIGVITTPLPVDEVSFEKDRVDTDVVAKATRDFWSALGVNQHLFTTDKTSSTALNKSVETDEQFMFTVLRQIERWVNRRLKYKVRQYNFKVEFLNVTHFNWKDMFDSYLKAAQYGAPVKEKMCAVLGYSPADLINMSFVENEIFELHNNFIPLGSSHTQPKNDSPDNEPGREPVDDDEITDSGEITRDTDGNEERE